MSCQFLSVVYVGPSQVAGRENSACFSAFMFRRQTTWRFHGRLCAQATSIESFYMIHITVKVYVFCTIYTHRSSYSILLCSSCLFLYHLDCHDMLGRIALCNVFLCFARLLPFSMLSMQAIMHICIYIYIYIYIGFESNLRVIQLSNGPRCR